MNSVGGRRFRAAAIGVLGGIVATLLAGALPAAATVGDVDNGTSLTRQMVVERALSWVDESVPYSQSTYWPASAPRTGAGRSYRQDCSGFVSMAWDLPGSAVTGDFVSSTSAYDTQLSSWNLLEPGDLLGVSGHVVLFLGWSANDNGQHRWFDMVSEATSGTNASVQTSQDRLGYWSSYLPFRDKHVVDDAPQTVSGGGQRLDQVTLDASGHVQHRWTTDGSTWSTQDLTATYAFVPFRTALTAASSGAGTLDVFGLTTDGRLADLSLTSAGWTQSFLATTSGVTGLAAAGTAGSIALVGRQHTTDAAGTLVVGHLTGRTWSGWSAVAGSPAVVDDPAVALAGPSGLDVVVEGTSGALALGTENGSSWSWSAPFGTTPVTVRPALAALGNGTLVVVADGGGTLQATTRAPGATTWSGFAALPGTPAVASAPSASSPDAQPWVSTGGSLDVFAESTAGTVVGVARATSGAWTYFGAGPVPDDATRTTAPRTLSRS